MAGYLVGSAIITWILCSALNGIIEYGAINGVLNRSKAFSGMVVGILVVAISMVVLTVWGFPASQLAAEHLTELEIQSVIKTSCWVNIMLGVGYCSFQLRRFWVED